jgi:hypothetical protein
MARPSEQSAQAIKDKSVLVMDCGASTKITGSLLHCTEVNEKQTKITTADGAETMRSSHTCKKT